MPADNISFIDLSGACEKFNRLLKKVSEGCVYITSSSSVKDATKFKKILKRVKNQAEKQYPEALVNQSFSGQIVKS